MSVFVVGSPCAACLGTTRLPLLGPLAEVKVETGDWRWTHLPAPWVLTLIVLAILRQAIGLQQSPPNQVLIGLSLFLSLFVMAPTLDKVNANAIAPYAAGTINAEQAIQAGGREFHHFMIRQTREHDLAMFAEMAKAPKFQKSDDVPFSILLPAFVTSELKTAFQIGFMLFLPFLIIDLVVSSVLMSLGMMMMSPMIVSLPFKLLLFVLVDGWALLMGSLAASFG